MLPAQLRPVGSADVAAAQAELVAVLQQMDGVARRLMLHGLLRPEAVLVGSYETGGHRCCPLASAVWEATGCEATGWAAVQDGIVALGLGPVHRRFVWAFDRWALVSGYEYVDSHGARILTIDGRSRLIGLIERVGGSSAAA